MFLFLCPWTLSHIFSLNDIFETKQNEQNINKQLLDQNEMEQTHDVEQ